MKLETIGAARVRQGVVAPAIAALAAAAVLLWPQRFPLDDAYITLHNARVLLSGAPDAVYGSSYLTGATSPAHLALVALLGATPWSSFAVGIVGAVIYLFGLDRIARDAGLSGWRRSSVLIIGGFNGHSIFQYLNGLETSLGMAIAAWMLVWRDNRKLAALAGAAPFVRPELGLLSVLLLARYCLQHRHETMRVAFVAVAGAIPFAAWVYSVTGRILPSTVGAKLAWFGSSHASVGIGLLAMLCALSTAYLLPLFLGLPGLLRVRGGLVIGCFVLAGLAASAWIMPSILEWNYGRYSMVYVPALILGVAAISAEKSKLSDGIVGLLTAYAVVTGGMSLPVYVTEAHLMDQVASQARFVSRLPRGTTVLIHDAGYVAWQNPPVRLVDVVGLKTPAAIEVNRRHHSASCAWGPALDELAQKSHASYMVVINRWSWPCMVDNLRRQGWRLTPIYNGYYTVYRIEPDAAETVGRTEKLGIAD